jgi:MFS superfamily sulfate permease-like transporter
MAGSGDNPNLVQRNDGSPLWRILIHIFPFLRWIKFYSASHFRADFIGGLTVALVLIPQSMAYAQLAGLPAYYGLYASLIPPLIASLFGSSNQLATGPVAIVSLMTNTALAPLATQGSEQFIAYAILLALMVGVFQFSLGVLRLGLVVNFLSHPVVNGFTNAAAIIIATSQLSKLFGVYVDKAEHHYETVYNVILSALHYTHLPTLAFAALAFFIMGSLKKLNPRIPNVLIAVIITTALSAVVGFENDAVVDITRIGDAEAREMIRTYNQALDDLTTKTEEKILLRAQAQQAEKEMGKHSIETITLHHQVAVADLAIAELKEEITFIRSELRSRHFEAVETNDGAIKFYQKGALPVGLTGDRRTWRLKVGSLKLNEKALKMIGGGAVVGVIPRGIPKFSPPKINFSVIPDLIMMAIIISLLGFMEAISIAKAMAAKTGQRLDPNQELIGQGLANIVGSFNQSYPVSGSFSRSAVNLAAGAVTGFSMAFSSLVVLITLLFLTPLLYHLPQAVLAAIIIMAVINLVNPRGFLYTWKAQKYDGAIAVITFISTLFFAPHLDKGIMIGVGLSLGHFLFRNMRPEMAILSKWKDGTYRNADRRRLHKCKHIAVIRFNNSLFFATVNYLEEKILEPITQMPHLKHIHIVGNGINELDASGIEVLSEIVERLREAGYDFSISGLNDEVLATMKRTHLYELIGEDHIFGNVALAINSVYKRTHQNPQEERCPLLEYLPLDEPTASSEL